MLLAVYSAVTSEDSELQEEFSVRKERERAVCTIKPTFEKLRV